MKRKFGNLLMAATLVLAVGSFFTSCRDYDEELVAMIDQQSQTIEALNKELSGSIADLKNEVNNALSSAQAEIAALEAQIAALNARIEVLEGINHDHSNFVTKDELAAAKAELAAAKAELEAAVKELADKKADKQTLEEVKASLEASIDELKGEFASHVELFNQLSATATEALGRLATLEGKYTALDERVKAIEDAKYQEQINAIKGDLEKVVKQAAEADARSKANEAAIKALEAHNVELAQAVKDSVAALRAEAAANLAEAKAYADEAAAAVAAELAKTNATIADMEAAFKSAVAELQDQIDVLQEEVDEVKEGLAEIEKELDLLNKKMDEMKENQKNQITSIILNGAYSPVVGYFSLPTGVKSNILAAYYGEAANDYYFPTTRTAYNVAGSLSFTDADFDVLGIQEIAQAGGIVIAEGANAGKLYMTLNPAEVSLTGKEFALVNSLGEESPVKILSVKESEDKLSFGYTRGAVALYEAEAAIAAEDVEAAKLRIELSDLKDALQDVVSVSDGVNVTDLVTTLYAVVNDIADANAVQATWADSYGDTHTVYSDYGLAAVAVKPLGYNFLADLNVSAMPGYNTAMNVLNKVFDKVGSINIPDNALAKLESISFNTIEDSIKFNLVIEGTTVLASVSTKDLLDDLGGVSLETLNKVIEAVNKALPLVSGKVEAVETQINAAMNKVQSGLNKYLDKLNNKLCSMVNSFNAALQPTMLVSTTDGFSLLSSIKAAPTTIDQASAVLVPTSFSGEILAPASKKFVAVTKAYDTNGNLDVTAAKAANAGDLNSVLEGSVRTVEFNGKSGYTYEIAYSAVDFYGMISTTKYYVKVK
ncbi:MAG: hypothetical protein IKY64_03155 [Bacteroidaceae bacterium]|nr:hypothetical protein [Bacteroidaceae bacterium]